MTLRTPQTGDRASAAEDRLIVAQLQDRQTRDLRDSRPPPFSERLLVGEIIAVLTGAGVPRYSWKLLYCDGSTVDPTWVDSLMRGTNETYPYLFEVNRAAGDEPSYKAGDRVLVHVVFSASGVSYVVDSLERAGVEGQTGIAVSITAWVRVLDNGTITLAPGDWRGRSIRGQVRAFTGTEANAKAAYDAAWNDGGVLTQRLAGPDCVADTVVYSGVPPGAGGQYVIRMINSGGDLGRIDFESTNFYAEYHAFVHLLGSSQLAGATRTID